MEIDNWEKLQIEALITDREGMIAENKQCEYEKKPMKFTYEDFMGLQQSMYGLLRG